MLVQEQIPGENKLLCTFPYDVQLCHATLWTSSCFFTDASVMWLLHNTLHDTHIVGVY